MATRVPMTAPKEGADVRVGRELGRDWGWILARTQRAEHLLREPAVMEMANSLAEYIDHYCDVIGMDPRDLEPDLAPTKTKDYITIRLNGIPCPYCNSGVMKNGQQCGRCQGSGFLQH